MAQQHARSGERVSVLPLRERLAETRTSAVIKAEQLEVVRIVLMAGKEMRGHSAPGEITVLCLEGEIVFRTPSSEQTLRTGDFVHLGRGEPHALKATLDSSALLTICLAA